MDKLYEKRLKRSFEKTLLDTPVPNRKIKFFPSGNKLKPLKSKAVKVLPEPLVPTKYVPPKPEPEREKTVPLPRLKKSIRKRDDRFFNRKINPLYTPEDIVNFEKILRPLKLPKEIVKEKERALKNSTKSYEVAIIDKRDPAKQLNYTRQYVKIKLNGFYKRYKGLKAYETLNVTLQKRKIEDGETFYEFKNVYCNSKTFTITSSDQIQDALDLSSEEIINRAAVWMSEGSGWTIEEILGHHINVSIYAPLGGNSCIPLPKELRNSMKGVINPKNDDEKCFLWSRVRHLNPRKIHRELRLQTVNTQKN